MKVLILNPPVKDVRFSRDGRCQSEENTWLDTFPPTTLASVAGALREKHRIYLMDCIGSHISWQDCLSISDKFNPDYIILNTSTPTITSDISIATEIKKLTNSEIIIYGEHVTSQYRHLLRKYPQISYAIIGEPETPIINILENNPMSPGVAFNKEREWDGGRYIEPCLDDLPMPAYDLLPTYNFPLSGQKWMFVRSGRGCPFNCVYCVMPLLSGKTPRFHSPEYMLNQFNYLVNRLKIKLFMLWDEIATYDRERMMELCDLIVQSRLKFKWFCTTRVDKFDGVLAYVMKNAGCEMISFGLESGSQKILNQNRKGITIEQSKKAIKAAKDNNIKTISHFVLGLPGSDINTEQETIEFAKSLPLSFAQFYIATPFPGSELYNLAIENNWFSSKDWSLTEQGTATLSYPNFSSEQIQQIRRKAYKEFYMRPEAAISALSMSSPLQLLKLPLYAMKFSKWMQK